MNERRFATFQECKKVADFIFSKYKKLMAKLAGVNK